MEKENNVVEIKESEAKKDVMHHQSSIKKQMPKTIRKYGLAWIIISPILFGMGALSLRHETCPIIPIGFVCFLIVAIFGFISGVATLFLQYWASKILEILSWICFLFYSGSGLVFLYSAVPIYIKNRSATFFYLSAGIVVSNICYGLFFLFLAKRIRKKLNEYKSR